MLFLCSNLSTIDWIRFVELLRLVPRVQQNEKYEIQFSYNKFHVNNISLLDNWSGIPTS